MKSCYTATASTGQLGLSKIEILLYRHSKHRSVGFESVKVKSCYTATASNGQLGLSKSEILLYGHSKHRSVGFE